ncbi:hypothetical protein QA596_01760 [Balneolales bacterium ANBcel1]|nr:hypothetical protein [Balneolales bacterium ANBcel1]
MDFNLWMFVTIAVIVWGIVEIVQSRTKAKTIERAESGHRATEVLQEKVALLERRIGNLEAVVSDDRYTDRSTDSAENKSDNRQSEQQAGKLSNNLR